MTDSEEQDWETAHAHDVTDGLRSLERGDYTDHSLQELREFFQKLIDRIDQVAAQ